MNQTPLLLLCVLLALASGARGQTGDPVAPDLEKEIRQMIRLTQADRIGTQVGQQVMSQLEMHSEKPLPAEFRDQMLAKFSNEQLIQLVVPVYARYLSLDDVRAINAFYGTASGQKILTVMPKLMAEAMQVAVPWGKKIAEEVAAEMKVQGYVHPKP